MGKESEFQAALVTEIEARFPGAYVLKNDPELRPGFPDLTVLMPNGKWAVLEAKREKNAAHRPNQDWYVEDLNGKSYSAFIYPENKEAVLDELQQALRA